MKVHSNIKKILAFCVTPFLTLVIVVPLVLTSCYTISTDNAKEGFKNFLANNAVKFDFAISGLNVPEDEEKIAVDIAQLNLQNNNKKQNVIFNSFIVYVNNILNSLESFPPEDSENNSQAYTIKINKFETSKTKFNFDCSITQTTKFKNSKALDPNNPEKFFSEHKILTTFVQNVTKKIDRISVSTYTKNSNNISNSIEKADDIYDITAPYTFNDFTNSFIDGDTIALTLTENVISITEQATQYWGFNRIIVSPFDWKNISQKYN